MDAHPVCREHQRGRDPRREDDRLAEVERRERQRSVERGLQTGVGVGLSRYCHHQYCMVCGLKGGGVYIAQWWCNSIAIG